MELDGVENAGADDEGLGAGTETATEVGVAEEEAAATLLSHAVQTVDVDVRVNVETVLNTDDTELPPDEYVEVTGQVVTVSYVTNVVVPSVVDARAELT